MSSMIVAFGGFPASSFDNNVFWYPIHGICSPLDMPII